MNIHLPAILKVHQGYKVLTHPQMEQNNMFQTTNQQCVSQQDVIAHRIGDEGQWRLIIFSALRAPDGSVYPLDKICTYMVYAHISMVHIDGVQTNVNGDFMMIQWDTVI